MDDVVKVRASSFGNAALEYERGRPSYPPDAVDWMIPAGASAAIDLGAGTGIFSRLLTAHGLAVTAVDPSAGMLAQLRESVSGVVAVEGTAENIPAADNSADLVTAAQAWHWVDDDLAFPEVARVLTPAGTLALVWNFRNNDDGWMKELGRIIEDRDERIEVDSVRRAHPLFTTFEEAVFPWSQTVNRAELLDLVASRSIFIVASADHQRRVLAEVDALLDTHPDVAGRSSYQLPYRTYCFRARAKE